MTSLPAELRSAVFLDRDGVLNESFMRDGKPYPPRTLSEVKLSKGAIEGCRRLRAAGLVLAVVTNQPDVARRTVAYSTVTEINAYLESHLGLDSVWVCPHDDADRCSCRKPAPGLLQQAAAHHGIDLQTSFMVGDRWRDIEAGRAAGCRTVLINHPDYDEPLPNRPDHTAADFTEAVSWILGRLGAAVPGASTSGQLR